MKHNKAILFSIGLVFLLSLNASAQKDKKEFYHLTHEMSKEEKELMKNYTRAFYETDPPVGEVRNIAEWEPMESVLIAYDGGFGIPYSLIAEMSEDCQVTTLVSGTSEENTVRSLFTSNGVNLVNCNFVHHDVDSWWTRDYSPWYIAVDDSEVAIVNFPYNRPRPNDDDTPIAMANNLGIDLYGMNVIHTGGNYMCEGYGMAASTDLVWDEESQTPAQINAKMLDYLGINTYHVTEDPLDDYIKHIDCWGKFLDADKILITQVPETDYRYDDYEAVANYFASQNCSWGYPYEVIRVQAADYSAYDTNPYTNSLILNDKVFVPQTGSSLDDDAITVYENAMPGYEIIGVYSNGWYNSDALHCRTHGIADREMLYIEHYPLFGEQSYQQNFTVEALVTSYGGSELAADFPKLFYRQNTGSWEEIVMTELADNNFTASIPALSGENTVEYYIHAENQNNRTEMHPNQGSFDPHVFSYRDENTLNYTNSEICFGESTGDITLVNYTSTITDWEKRLDNGDWQSIGFTGETYTEIPASAGLWEYRVELDNGDNYSSIAELTVFEETTADFTYNTDKLEVTFTNESLNATEYYWQFGDGNDSDLESPVHTYAAEGTYTVYLTASNTVCPFDDISYNVTVSESSINHLENNIAISPNPNQGNFIISGLHNTGSIEIIDISGRIVLQQSVLNNEISVTGLRPGIYLIHIKTETNSSYQKIIVE
jgi:agmatine deiminase